MNFAHAHKFTSPVTYLGIIQIYNNKNMIKPELYNNILDDAENEIKLNAGKTRYARYLDWWKYNSYFMYPGSWGL